MPASIPREKATRSDNGRLIFNLDSPPRTGIGLGSITGKKIDQLCGTRLVNEFVQTVDKIQLLMLTRAIGGTLYFSGGYAEVYAVNGLSGKLLWKFDPQTWKRDPAKMHFSFGANRGAAYENGKVFAVLMAVTYLPAISLWLPQTVLAR